MVDGRECVIRIVRDDGLGDLNPTFLVDQDRWRVPSDGLEGFGGVAYEVSTQPYAQYDGSYLLSERVPERDRTIVAHAWFDPREARAEAERFFIPRRSYEVHVTYMGRTRYFVGRQYALDLSTGNVWGRLELTWTCLATDPMWLSEDEKRFDIAEAVGGFGFPFMSLAEPWELEAQGEPEAAEGVEEEDGTIDYLIGGFVVGVLSDQIAMDNGGAVTAYPRFDISAAGDVVRPEITVTDASGAVVCEVGLDLTLHDGDALTVDFSSRPTTVELSGENVSHLVTSGSTLAAGIEVGEFSLGWSAESGDAALSVRPSIRERYLSV